ncbi:MAG: hypothetical protein V7K22_20865 [Nostoc sp.]|uniref:hypothetical protein n=1 Tax=Nostoc sp. TaxID=1180 RepID=UPI001D2F0754|nr:hypothetical protein [Nostoc sp. JL23]
MTATTPVLTDSKTLNEVVNCLTENIPIQAQGKCEQRNVIDRNYGVACEIYLPSG